MVKALTKAHFLKSGQGTHGIHPSHASTLDDKAYLGCPRMTKPFLVKDLPGLTGLSLMGIKSLGHRE